MAQNPFIRFNCKKTDEIDWAAPLRTYIATTYQDDPDKYLDELTTFNRLRQDMRGAGLDSTGRDLLYRYYGQLDLLELRFPVDENNIRISFSWYDVFNQKPISQYSLAYEKACVIFNIAAVLSAMGASQIRSELFGLKQAFNYLQLSAGIYSYINENFLHAPSSDLNRDVIKIMVQFLLAQAQECFMEKCLLDKKKGSMIAKLASQATYLYSSLIDNLSEGLPRTLFGQNFVLLAQVKQKYYSSVANYHKALSLEEEAQYGESVSRFTLAEVHAKESTRLAANLSRSLNPSKATNFTPDCGPALIELTKANHELILEKRDSAIKDNELVYHDTVTKPEVLAPIEKLVAAKPIPFTELYTPADVPKIIGPDVFHKLIPLSIHESASLYSEEKAKIIRKEVERVDLTNVELDTSLSYMDLPQCLSKFKKNSEHSIQDLTEPPEEILRSNKQIYHVETSDVALSNILSNLRQSNGNLRKSLDEASSILDDELRSCESLRAQHQDLWTQEPSGSAASSIRQDIRARRELLEKALSSDETLFNNYNRHREEFEILCSNPDSDVIGQRVAEAVASSAVSNSSERGSSLVDIDKEDSLSGIISSIEDCLARLNLLKKERHDVLQDLKDRVQNDDISHVLILNKRSAVEPQIFANELEKYRGHQNRITATVHHQQAALQELTAHVKRLLSANEAQKINQNYDSVSRAKNGIVSRLKSAATVYNEIREEALNGQDFYKKLNLMVENILVEARRFAGTRKGERDDLVKQIGLNQSQTQFDQLQANIDKYSQVKPNDDTLSRQMQNLSFQDTSLPSQFSTPGNTTSYRPTHPYQAPPNNNHAYSVPISQLPPSNHIAGGVSPGQYPTMGSNPNFSNMQHSSYTQHTLPTGSVGMSPNPYPTQNPASFNGPSAPYTPTPPHGQSAPYTPTPPHGPSAPYSQPPPGSQRPYYHSPHNPAGHGSDPRNASVPMNFSSPQVYPHQSQGGVDLLSNDPFPVRPGPPPGPPSQPHYSHGGHPMSGPYGGPVPNPSQYGSHHTPTAPYPGHPHPPSSHYSSPYQPPPLPPNPYQSSTPSPRPDYHHPRPSPPGYPHGYY